MKKRLFFIVIFICFVFVFSSTITVEKGYSWGVARKAGGDAGDSAPWLKGFSLVIGWGTLISDAFREMSLHGENTHEGFIYTGYNNARVRYMSENPGEENDPCWKVSGSYCSRTWLAPALTNIALSIMFQVFAKVAKASPITMPVMGGPPAAPAWVAASVACFGLWVTFMEPIGRADWLESAQVGIDSIYASRADPTKGQINKFFKSSWHFDMNSDDYNANFIPVHIDSGEIPVGLLFAMTSTGRFNNENNRNQIMQYISRYAKKMGRTYFGYENDPDDYHLRRWLDGDSLAVHLHAIADFSAHSKFAQWLIIRGKDIFTDGIPEDVGIIRFVDKALRGVSGYSEFYYNQLINSFCFASGNHSSGQTYSDFDYNGDGEISGEEIELSKAGEQIEGENKKIAYRMAYQDCEDLIYSRLKRPIPFTD